MPNLTTILAERGAFAGMPTAQAGVRASLAWACILDKPTDAEFVTAAGVTLPSQKVRLESDNSSSSLQSASGVGPKRNLIIFGIRSHPTLPDTDMQEGYTFTYDMDEYTCIDVILTIGEKQGVWQANG